MSDLSLFLGRFHPLFVHFPIALLLLAALLQGLAARRHARRGPSGGADLNAALGLTLWLAAIGAVASATAGLLLGSSGTYGGPTYERHMWLGLSVATLSLISALLWSAGDRGSRWARARVVLLAAAVCLLIPAGHFGATLTHGEGFLTEHAPSLLREVLGAASPDAVARAAPESLRVYDTLVAPALETHCVTCHGPAKVEGGLRLDTLSAISKGGEHGAIVAAGRADASEIVRRVWLPQSHPDAMPPKGHRPLAPADALLLGWWIDQGATGELTLGDAEIPPAVAPVLEAIVGPLERGGPAVPRGAVAAASRDAVAGIAAGFSVEPVASDTPFLHVHATNTAHLVDDAAVATLARVGPQVLWLDLAGSRVTDAGLSHVARLPNLTRLHLQRTAVGDAGVAHLAQLAHLEYLNLYGTRVTDEGLQWIAGIKALRSLYLWQTAVTEVGVAKLTTALPRLRVEIGAPAGENDAKPAGNRR